MSLFDFFVRRSADKAVRDYLRSAPFEQKLRGVVDDIIRNDPKIQFVKAMQLEMLRVDPTMDYRKAWHVALVALKEWLDGEKIAFGDDRYDWSDDAAVELIREMEIDHWESAP